MPDRPDFEAAVRALYQGPLPEFVAARQALAKRLKAAQEPRHGEVRELRKPGLSAWAVNQLFAREPQAMAALLAAAEGVRAARERAEGGDDPGPLREALAALRSEIERLGRRGAELLAAVERAPGEAIVARMRTNLEALALDPATGAVGARGWLDEDLEPPGFAVLAALQVAAVGARPSAGPSVTAAAAVPAVPRSAAPAAPVALPRLATVHSFDEGRDALAVRREREARAAEERRERERRERLERLRAELARAEAEAAAQQQGAEQAAVAAETASREAAAAEQRAEEARTTARKARERAASAAAAAVRAREALARAEGG